MAVGQLQRGRLGGFVGDRLKQGAARGLILFEGGELAHHRIAGTPELDQPLEALQPLALVARAVALDQLDDGFGRVGVDAVLELVEDGPGAALDFEVVVLEGLLQRRLGRPARFPKELRGLFAGGKVGVAELADPASQLLLAGGGQGGGVQRDEG